MRGLNPKKIVILVTSSHEPPWTTITSLDMQHRPHYVFMEYSLMIHWQKNENK